MVPAETGRMEILRILVFGLLGFACTQALADTLPLASRIEDRAKREKAQFLQDMAGLILGHGTAAGIDAAGLQQSVDLRRAAIRAREIARLLKADRDGDMRVDRAELDVLQSLSTTGVRGRLEVAFREADLGGSGIVDPPELHDHAGRRAMIEVSPRHEADLMTLMALDQDRDAHVSIDEVALFLANLTPET